MRPEANFTSLEALIDAIKCDIAVSRDSLKVPPCFYVTLFVAVDALRCNIAVSRDFLEVFLLCMLDFVAKFY